MKNTIKNILTTGILTSALMVGATTSAQAGLLVSDRSAAPQQTCNQAETVSLATIATNALSLAGLLISDRSGLLISDRAGILLSDKSGLLVSDRNGLLMSDRAAAATCTQP